jgi:hypothetical protein
MASWVTVRQPLSEAEATLLATALDQHGVECRVWRSGASFLGALPTYELQVQAEFAAQVAPILSRLESSRHRQHPRLSEPSQAAAAEFVGHVSRWRVAYWLAVPVVILVLSAVKRRPSGIALWVLVSGVAVAGIATIQLVRARCPRCSRLAFWPRLTHSAILGRKCVHCGWSVQRRTGQSAA